MAGGLGTRMRSPKPKVLHDLCGAPMLAWVEAAAREAGADDVVVVVSPAIADEVRAAFPHVQIAVQSPANGTGHAVEVGLEALAGRAEHVLILSGDTPAIRAETVQAVREAGSVDGVDGALAIARVAPPHAYGRVVRSGGASSASSRRATRRRRSSRSTRSTSASTASGRRHCRRRSRASVPRTPRASAT